MLQKSLANNSTTNQTTQAAHTFEHIAYSMV